MDNSAFSLSFQEDRLICIPAAEFGGPFWVEFSPARYACPHKELLIKAIGAKKSTLPTVCDLTAGFGQDAYLIYRYGCAIQLVERCNMIAQLLQDGLRRAQACLPLYVGEARDFVSDCVKIGHYFDVVYLDPIFPPKVKTALSAKSARLLRALAGEGHDAQELFDLAQQLARQRIVVKRAKNSPFLSAHKPDVVYRGKSIRFDVYFMPIAK